MPSSTFVSDCRVVPAQCWGTVLALVIMIEVICVASWESFWRAHYFVPDDSSGRGLHPGDDQHTRQHAGDQHNCGIHGRGSSPHPREFRKPRRLTFGKLLLTVSTH